LKNGILFSEHAVFLSVRSGCVSRELEKLELEKLT